MTATADGVRSEAATLVRDWLHEVDVAAQEPTPGLFVFDLPGERKLTTPCRLVVAEHSLALHAFVCRNPDENHEALYRWLLTRNMRMPGVGFAIDHNGDIFIEGRLPLAAVTADALDALIGTVLSYADESFNTILELGFATSIRQEWQWRLSRGESTVNLEAFRNLMPDQE